ncbi:MAG TPA: PfkB family carbohydrate kinase [Mycobacteriales bacterium]|nr:PfkB family carbohydrate kinase [Mycobacteriales bacterium]
MSNAAASGAGVPRAGTPGAGVPRAGTRGPDEPAGRATAPGGTGPRIVVVGDAALDVLARADALPVPGGDARATIALRPGGAGANTAAWLAACGARPVLVSRVGTDPAAAQVRAELAAAGVDAVLAADPGAPTCTVLVLVDRTGQRTMLADRGAAGRLDPADIATSALAGARHLHLSGYVLLDESSRPAGLAALAAARRAGLTTSVDPQAAELLEPGFLDLVRDVDLLLPSAGELAALGGAAAVLDAVGAIAVTAGPGGATWLDRDGGLWNVPAAPVDPVDTTGAGDAFDAGLLAARIGGATPLDALRAGVAAGTRAVQHPGAWP